MATPFDELAFSTYHEIIAAELRNSISRYNDLWEDVLWKNWMNYDQCAPWVEQYRLPVIILTCTLLESVINFYLCTKCDAKLFEKLERKSLGHKWGESPKTFVPTYALSPDIIIDLKRLTERRNSIIHPKPFISIDGDNRHAGNEPTIAVDEHKFMEACSTLPYRLVENLLGHDDVFREFSDLRTRCQIIARDFETGLHRQKTLFDYPRELIEELMTQGFGRRTAIHCAIFL